MLVYSSLISVWRVVTMSFCVIAVAISEDLGPG